MNWRLSHDGLREVLMVMLVAMLLLLPMVGLRTVDSSSGLGIDLQIAAVFWAVLLIGLGKKSLVAARENIPVIAYPSACLMLLIGFLAPLPTGFLEFFAFAGGFICLTNAILMTLRGGRPISKNSFGEGMDIVAAKIQAATPQVAWVMFAIVVALPFVFPDRYVLDVSILILTYIMLGWGLNIIVGLAGLLDLGYVAFYAVGAYSYALLAINFDLSFWVCLPLAGILAAFWGLLLGFPVLRLRGDYFAIVTLGFGEIIRVVLINWYQVTGGPDGINSIPRPSFFGLAEFTRRPSGDLPAFHEMFGLDYSSIHRIIFLYYLILVLALVVNFLSVRLRKMPIGRAWEAMREDEIACKSLGLNRTNLKLMAFMISATFGGFAGAFFATKQGFISPESFTFIESAIILAIVVLGGMGSQLGIVIATLLVIGLPEIFRDLELYRMLTFGIGMVLVMVWRPRGLLAVREPSIRLHGKGVNS